MAWLDCKCVAIFCLISNFPAPRCPDSTYDCYYFPSHTSHPSQAEHPYSRLEQKSNQPHILTYKSQHSPSPTSRLKRQILHPCSGYNLRARHISKCRLRTNFKIQRVHPVNQVGVFGAVLCLTWARGGKGGDQFSLCCNKPRIRAYVTESKNCDMLSIPAAFGLSTKLGPTNPSLTDHANNVLQMRSTHSKAKRAWPLDPR